LFLDTIEINGDKMSEKEDRIKKAFELSDELFSREKDNLMIELAESLRKITNEYERRGLTNSRLPVEKRNKKREEIIKKLVNYHVKSDLNEVSKITHNLSENIANSIFKRAQQIVMNPLKGYRFEMVSNEEELKNRLLSGVKREIKIRKMTIENQSPDKKESLLRYIQEKIQSINRLMTKDYNIELFKIQDQKIWSYLDEICLDEKSFDSQINALKSIIDWINESELKINLKNKAKCRSVGLLELFLKEHYVKYNLNIIKRFRRIITIRKKLPIHKNTPELERALAELRIPFPIPPDKFQKYWTIILIDFIVSLRELEEILSSNIK